MQCKYCPPLRKDFMDALCDPRAFLSAQEKRAEQMKALGIEEADISDNVIQSKKEQAGGAGTGGAGAGDKKEDGKNVEKKGHISWLKKENELPYA